VSLTPVEIRHVTFHRRPLGYARGAVHRFLGEVTRSFEDVWRERADLRDEVERLEGEVERYRELDVLLRNSLVSAERAADDLRAQAGKEAAVILEEARLRAREIVAQAEAERERLRGEVRRLKALEAEVRASYRAFLLGALRRVDGDADAEPGDDVRATANGTAEATGHAA
jgi:cell division initiation protein